VTSTSISKLQPKEQSLMERLQIAKSKTQQQAKNANDAYHMHDFSCLPFRTTSVSISFPLSDLQLPIEQRLNLRIHGIGYNSVAPVHIFNSDEHIAFVSSLFVSDVLRPRERHVSCRTTPLHLHDSHGTIYECSDICRAKLEIYCDDVDSACSSVSPVISWSLLLDEFGVVPFTMSSAYFLSLFGMKSLPPNSSWFCRMKTTQGNTHIHGVTAQYYFQPNNLS